MKLCPKCKRTESADKGYNYCMNCGTALITMPCSGCGKEVPAGANFCPYCGKKYRNNGEPVQQEIPVQQTPIKQKAPEVAPEPKVQPATDMDEPTIYPKRSRPDTALCVFKKESGRESNHADRMPDGALCEKLAAQFYGDEMESLFAGTGLTAAQAIERIADYVVALKRTMFSFHFSNLTVKNGYISYFARVWSGGTCYDGGCPAAQYGMASMHQCIPYKSVIGRILEKRIERGFLSGDGKCV